MFAMRTLERSSNQKNEVLALDRCVPTITWKDAWEVSQICECAP